MSKFKTRWTVAEWLVVVVVMAAALASAAIEVSALAGALSSDAAWRTQAASASAGTSGAPRSATGGVVVSAVLAGGVR